MNTPRSHDGDSYKLINSFHIRSAPMLLSGWGTAHLTWALTSVGNSR